MTNTNTLTANVLIIDDDPGFCYTLTQLVEPLGHAVASAHSLADGMALLSVQPFDLVFLDVQLPDGNGLKALSKIKKAPSLPEVIIITSRGEIDGAELAIKNGAWDYIEKPSSLKDIRLPFLRALQYREERHGKAAPVALTTEGIIGASPLIEDRKNRVAQAARSDVNVLITGETGTGKELFARAIHANSRRAENSFVVVDCAALPENLVESMLFGHEKGAFTGATGRKTGLIQQADTGTLFLDEIGELPLKVQKAFLRAIQERSFRPIGSRSEVESDFRLIVATHRNLEAMAARDQFRSDLLFRLRAFTLDLPPLRKRKEDILDLTMFHMGNICRRYGTGTKGISPDFLKALSDYGWPGNVRELFHSLETALAVAGEDPTLFPYHLPDQIRIKLSQKAFKQKDAAGRQTRIVRPDQTLPLLKDYRFKIIAAGEKQYLQELLALTGDDLQQACRVSGLGRARLYGLMKKHGISRPSKNSQSE